jgi:LAGLIDADG endonuclease
LVDLNSYISGYVDGEGCFCVSFQPSVRHRFRWEVRPSFSVSQNLDRSEVLYLIQKMWKCGFIRPYRSDKTLKYEVRNIEALITTVLPHFRQFPLRSSKQVDYEKFAKVCEAINELRTQWIDATQAFSLSAGV